MGDRALVVFIDKEQLDISPTVYLHQRGRDVPEFINRLKFLMADRPDDLGYSTARFIGICHDGLSGNLSLGVWNTPIDFMDWPDDDYLEYADGDEGLFIVDIKDFSFKQYK